MRFKVLPPTRRVPQVAEPTWFLVQDNWNDYSFQTLYHLHLATPNESTSIGAVKILRKGQTGADTLQITQDFDALDKQFASAGQSLDYYEHLAALGQETRDAVLTRLRDVVKLPDIRPLFKEEAGWHTSLFRDQTDGAVEEFLLLAASLLHGDYTSLPSNQLTFSFQMSGWENPLQFDFRSAVDPLDPWPIRPSEIPDRVIALIGRNGSGKSTVLARLARVAFGTTAQRASGSFRHLGVIDPVGIGFPRIITVSYSAFDSFTLPGLPAISKDAPDEREQIIQDARQGVGRYVFCGLRDIAGELENQIRDETTQEHSTDRVSKTSLKSIAALSAEFGNTLESIKRQGRVEELGAVFGTFATDPSFSFWKGSNDLKDWSRQRAEELFLTWSTGQKIVAQVGASLVAHLTPLSLVLLDEPEMHLHPPLLATLMHAVRHLLRTHKAFAIIATHSPVVLQETAARHIYIVRRDDEITEISKPSMETFGENVGFLTTEVFGLNSQVTDFHKVLDALVASHQSLESIERLFAPYGLSLQARAYVMSRLPKEGDA